MIAVARACWEKRSGQINLHFLIICEIEDSRAAVLYLVYHGATGVEPADGVYKFVIEQGDFIKRPSRIGLEVRGAPRKVDEVRVGGPSVVVAKGTVEF